MILEVLTLVSVFELDADLRKIYLCGITATPPNKEIHKTALGATNGYLGICKRCFRVVNQLKQENVKVYSVENKRKMQSCWMIFNLKRIQNIL